jgi:predicted ArsR family transcriptional regulator
MMPDSHPPRCVQRKYPTKATKREFLEAIARIRGVDVVTLAQYFRMSYSGARGKLRRLRLQSLVETVPGTHGLPKAWQLTAAGWRLLRHLQEGQTYGGSKEKLIESLRAEVLRLKAERDHWMKIVKDVSGIFKENERLADENMTLRRQRDEACSVVRQPRERAAAHQRPLLPRTRSQH